ncbi:MAG: ABC transporter ATP-binding protein, partial [Methanosarcinales archaeon]
YYYPNTDKPALEDINLEIKDGEFVLLVGPSGCGKSTLIKCFNGLIPKVTGGVLKGNISINGKNVEDYKVHQLALEVGMVFQNPDTQLFAITVEEDIAFGPENIGLSKDEIIKRVNNSLQTVRMEDYRNKYIFSLSGGQKQRVAVAGSLAMEPNILVFDEPTSDLDPIGTREVLETIKKLNKEKDITIILIEHKLNEVANLVDRVIVMDNGKIFAEGTAAEIFNERFYEVKKIGIKPPQITEISMILQKLGHNIKNKLSFEEVYNNLSGLFKSSYSIVDCGMRNAELIRNPKSRATPTFATKARMVRERPKGATSDNNSKIVIEDLEYIHEDGTVALKGINLVLNKGEFVAIIGKNGAGKSTLASLLIGLLKPTHGKIFIDGIDTKNKKVADLAQKIGYLFQNPDNQIFTSKVFDEVAFGLRNINLDSKEVEYRVEKSLKTMELWEYKERHPHSLSRGQRQRLAVASILAMEPDILVLDEPTTGQDYGHIEKFMSLVKKLNNGGKTIILITHDMGIVAEYANRTIVMKNGEIFLDGNTRDVFFQTELLKESFIEPPISTIIANKLRKNLSSVPRFLTVEDLRLMLYESRV